MENMRAKLRRKLSLHDKAANIDEHEDMDDEAVGNLHREIDAADDEELQEPKPGSLLSRLIEHGNKKTDDHLTQSGNAQK